MTRDFLEVFRVIRGVNVIGVCEYLSDVIGQCKRYICKLPTALPELLKSEHLLDALQQQYNGPHFRQVYLIFHRI